MLVRSTGAFALTLVCASVSVILASDALAGSAATTKRLAAKALDHDGYSPALLRGPADLLAEVEPNDSAAQAQAILVGDSVDAMVVDADVDWFSVSAAAGTYLTASTSPILDGTTDTVLEVFASDGTTRLAIDDDGGLGLFSAVEHLLVPGDGIVLLRVVRFGPLGGDDYRLNVESGVAPPASPENDTPATAIALESCNTSITGTTVGASSATDAAACVQFAPLGGDVFYVVELPYSYQLTVRVEPNTAWDPSLYLFTDGGDPFASCIGGNDEAYAGEPETVIFTNEDESTPSKLVYVAVDSWEGAQNGEFALFVSCDFVVGTESGSWGSLKARFDR